MAEEELGRPLPADLKAWWSYADGAHLGSHPDGGPLIPPWFVPYSISEALKSRRVWMEVARQIAPVPIAQLEAFIAAQNELPAGTGCETWLPAWLPIATDAGGANLFVDLRGGRRHGCVMEYYKDAGASAGPEWADVAAMLYDIADRLAEGGPERVDEGRVHWG